jgi:signal transduction histidine kinase
VDTLLDEETLDEQTTREYLHLISKENQRLSRLIESFLTFSRIERGKLALDLRHTAPETIVQTAIEAAGERFQGDECELRVSIADDLPNVLVDQDGMVTVLLNLLDNAYKYSNPVRQIDVTAKMTADGVAFTVDDNGIGISRSARRRVFQRFFQVDRGLSRAGEGCGLGLSIVQSIVAAHSGRVALRSELGKGSSFAVTLPASDSREEDSGG